MSTKEKTHTGFLGKYFDPNTVLRLSSAAGLLAWALLVIYVLDFVIAITVFALQLRRGFMVGLGYTDYIQNIIFILERPMRGVIYFLVLQAISKGLLVALDIEDNTRRAARAAAGKSE
jgi:hypothetical protein